MTKRKTNHIKLGEEFWASLPGTPGIYRVFDADDVLVYVGKAKNLRRRLGQYRNARRLKAHRKMRAVMKAAVRIETETCETHRAALLLELRSIQVHQPRLNVAGVFHFMYPMIGIKTGTRSLDLILTGKPEVFSGFEWHGTYRLRRPTRRAFFALTRLLAFLGPSKKMRLDRNLFSFGASFAELEADWASPAREFFMGESPFLLEMLILALADRGSARAKREDIQEDLGLLKKFWKQEALALRRLRQQANFSVYPVPQLERDALRILALTEIP